MYKFRNSAKKRTKVRRFSQTSALCYAILVFFNPDASYTWGSSC